MPEFSPFAVLERQKPIDLEIRSSERALGIHTAYDRLNEASLFIDRKFLNYGIITGVTKKPERIFGDNEWADYLDGRLFAKEYGQQDLTPAFVTQLHTKLTTRSNLDVGGKLRDIGVIGGSFDSTGEPIVLPSEQVAAINSNPQLSFKKIEAVDGGERGHIVYPHSDTVEITKATADYHARELRRKFGAQYQEYDESAAPPPATIKDAVTKDLEEICEWFNIAKGQDQYNPHILAGLLQQRLASLHPFEDVNGTLSRVLMNWSLENDGEAPSALENPSADIYNDEETWIAKVSEGSNRYAESKKRQKMLREAGIDDLSALFGTGQDQVFYEYIFKHLKKAPPLPTNGDKHNHEKYEKFLEEFNDEMRTFQDFMARTSTVHATNGDHEITQGGLITPEFMHFALNTKLHVLPEALRTQLFSDVEVYRGGMIDGEVTDEKICQMFTQYTGVGTGYRALQRSHLPATSGQRVTGNVIQESLEYYNKMLAKSYFIKKHGDIPNPYSGGAATIRDIASTAQDHISGGKNIWNSPFASTSLDRRISAGFAQKFESPLFADAQHGVLFTAQVPREGTILTHGQKEIEGIGLKHKYESEREVLLPGALTPASITAIEVFDRYSEIFFGQIVPKVIARREERDGQSVVIIDDRRGAVVVKRTYTYNPAIYRYEFTAEEHTQELVPAEVPPKPTITFKNNWYDISALAHDIKPLYIPALKEESEELFIKKDFTKFEMYDSTPEKNLLYIEKVSYPTFIKKDYDHKDIMNFESPEEIITEKPQYIIKPNNIISKHNIIKDFKFKK
ncbi:MAG: Fic family protein [Candidatus Levybacteria bacterium]|nr:Fic family protein [Candidatus Levybacteria bacterium]